MTDFKGINEVEVFSRGQTNIDRRKTMRTVPMEVLNMGLPRTGTSSIRQALFMLGYDDVYHMGTVIQENPSDADLWTEAFKAKYEGKGKLYGRMEFDRLLGHCMAVCDYPPSAFGPEILDAYPEAQVILSTRDTPEAWRKSVYETIYIGSTVVGPLKGGLIDYIKKTFWYYALPIDGTFGMMRTMFASTFTGDFKNDGHEMYILHNDEVRAMCKARGRPLLEFNAKQGWKPLCDFLGKPIPTDKDGNELPFPRVNDSKNIKQNIGQIITTQMWQNFANRGVYQLTTCIAVGAIAFNLFKNRDSLIESLRVSMLNFLMPGSKV